LPEEVWNENPIQVIEHLSRGINSSLNVALKKLDKLIEKRIEKLISIKTLPDLRSLILFVKSEPKRASTNDVQSQKRQRLHQLDLCLLICNSLQHRHEWSGALNKRVREASQYLKVKRWGDHPSLPLPSIARTYV